MSEPDKVLGWLRSARLEIGTFDQTTYRQDRWVRWHNEMRSTLRNVFGEDSHEYKEYGGVSGWGRPIAGFGQAEIDAKSERKFNEILSAIRGWLEALILQVERFRIKSSDEPHESDESSPVEPSDKASAPWRYLVTSPVFLVEKSVGLLIDGWGWCTENKGISALFGVTMLVAAVLTIAGVIKL